MGRYLTTTEASSISYSSAMQMFKSKNECIVSDVRFRNIFSYVTLFFPPRSLHSAVLPNKPQPLPNPFNGSGITVLPHIRQMGF
jgi:hypothetical protein